MFTDADNFGVQFPMDMDVKMKATILGACFLIVSLYQFIITAEFITDQEENMFPFSREVT